MWKLKSKAFAQVAVNVRPSSGANLPLQDLLLNANARESINQRQCKLDILWNLKVLGSFLLCSIYMYDSPANVFLNSLALCFSLILLTLVCLTFQSLSFAGCGKAWHSLGADIDWCTREQSSVQCTLSPALQTSWSVRRTGFNQSGQPIQNQESETQVCVKQARLIRLSVASKSMLAEPADFDFYGPSGFHHSPLTNLKWNNVPRKQNLWQHLNYSFSLNSNTQAFFVICTEVFFKHQSEMWNQCFLKRTKYKILSTQ